MPNKKNNYYIFMGFLLILLFVGYKAYQDSLVEYPVEDLGFTIEATDGQ